VSLDSIPGSTLGFSEGDRVVYVGKDDGTTLGLIEGGEDRVGFLDGSILG
jgi:hypothetical protein